jgi:hypothetical protein
VAFDLFDRLHIDQWPGHRAGLEPVGDLHRAGGLGEALGKGVIDTVLHQDTVRVQAGLAVVAIFRGDRTLDRDRDAAIAEDDKRRILQFRLYYQVEIRH